MPERSGRKLQVIQVSTYMNIVYFEVKTQEYSWAEQNFNGPGGRFVLQTQM